MAQPFHPFFFGLRCGLSAPVTPSIKLSDPLGASADPSRRLADAEPLVLDKREAIARGVVAVDEEGPPPRPRRVAGEWVLGLPGPLCIPGSLLRPR